MIMGKERKSSSSKACGTGYLQYTLWCGVLVRLMTTDTERGLHHCSFFLLWLGGWKHRSPITAITRHVMTVAPHTMSVPVMMLE